MRRARARTRDMKQRALLSWAFGLALTLSGGARAADRIYDNPVTEKYNHGQQYNNDVGLWVRSTFLSAEVGPVAARDTFSVWP